MKLKRISMSFWPPVYQELGDTIHQHRYSGSFVDYLFTGAPVIDGYYIFLDTHEDAYYLVVMIPA